MIVVAGAGGFVGTYLVDALVAQGFSVRAVDCSPIAEEYYRDRGIPFLRADITDHRTLAGLPADGVDAVVNLACLQPVNVSAATYRPADYISVNVIGTLNLLQYAVTARVPRFIYTISHRGVQGLWDRGEVITEQSRKALKLTGDYAMFSISEIAAQDCVEHYAAAHGLQALVLRLPPVYGYGPHLEGYRDGVPVRTGFLVFIEQARAGKPIELWGDCDRARDVVYVKDVVNAILLSLRAREARGLYNIASGERVSLRQEAEEIARVFGPPGTIPQFVFRPERPNSVEPFQYDISRARRDLQWVPRFGLRAMLEDIKAELESGRFGYLVEKRRRMLAEGSSQESTAGGALQHPAGLVIGSVGTDRRAD